MLIKGRHPVLRPVNPMYQGQVNSLGVIRIDDAANQDFWLEIDLSDEELEKLIKNRKETRSTQTP